MRADVFHDREQFFETNWYCYIYNSNFLHDGNYANVHPISNKINNPKYFNSNFCINNKGDRIILSRCTSGEDGDLKCALWQTEKNKKGWTKPKLLPKPINGDDFSSMHPYLVEYEDHDILYFVSNRPNGYGGTDIWYSVVNDGCFQAPVNLGPIVNTEGNEVTPFYDRQSSRLFFSSDDRKGFGDYDIWVSSGALAGWQNPQLLPKPFNSEYNDLYFNMQNDGKGAFFSSNRPTSDYSNDDTCCNDLYRITWDWVKKHEIEPVDTLSQIREKIASVLPITLYFQNDSPDPRSLADTTSRNYYELFEEYVGDIQDYIHKSGQGLSGDEQRETMYSVAFFMRDSVKSGYERLKLLTQYLKESMEMGDTISLEIRGFASPLHNSDYNKHLSSRRIVSLLNYLRTAENGVLGPYIDGRKPGISIEKIPEGAVEHSFDTDKVRETVFGLRAAKDRRIVVDIRR